MTPAHVLVWDLEVAKRNCDTKSKEDTLVHRLAQHLGWVQDLDFSHDDRYLATLGGQVGLLTYTTRSKDKKTPCLFHNKRRGCELSVSLMRWWGRRLR